MALKAPGKREEALQAIMLPPHIPAWKGPEFAEFSTVGLCPPLCPLCLAQGGPKQVFTGVKESRETWNLGVQSSPTLHATEGEDALVRLQKPP